MSRAHAIRLGKRQAADVEPWLEVYPDKAHVWWTHAGMMLDDAHVEAVSGSFAAWLETQHKDAKKRLSGVNSELVAMATLARAQRERQERADEAAAIRAAAVEVSEAQMVTFLAPLCVPTPWQVQGIRFMPENTRYRQNLEVELAYRGQDVKRPVTATILALCSSAGLHWELRFKSWTHLQIISAPVSFDTLAEALAAVAAYEVQG